jgi:hypothetical protein
VGSGATGRVAAPEPSEQGGGVRSCVVAPELSRTGSRVRSRDMHGNTRALPHAMLLTLVWSLYAGLPGPQGTDSSPRVLLGRGGEPAGGAKIFFTNTMLLE